MDIVAVSTVLTAFAVPRDTDTVDPVSASAVIMAPGENEKLSIASGSTSNTAPVEEPSPRASVFHHVYSKGWSALGPVLLEEFPLTRAFLPDEAPVDVVV
jgi:hypothetical protein